MQINRLIQLYTDEYDFSDVQPFVFSGDKIDEPVFDDGYDDILACPFQKFSIELDGYNGLVGFLNDKSSVITEHVVRCVLVNELSPNVYDVIALIERWVNDEKVNEFSVNYPPEENECIREFKSIIHEYLSRLHKSDNGTFSGNGRAKYKYESKKRFFRPRGVIYVGKKNKQKSTAIGNIINWSNSWNVMAHWRRLSNPESFGLDRHGNRTAEGYTWISNYVKGEGPMSNKVRIVG